MTLTVPAIRRIATYERVSSEGQAERETIDMQTSALDARLALEANVQVVARYADDGVSGTKALGDRSEGARLLRDASAGRFDELWVYRVDRLGRKVADIAKIADVLDELGIAIVTVTQGRLEPFLLHISAALAQEELRTLRQRSAGGIAEAAKKGRYVGGIAPYGYRAEGEKGHARLVPDDQTVWGDWTAVDVINRLYEAVALEDRSCRQVADELNALGIPTHYARDGRGVRGKNTQGIWRSGRIRNMIVEPIYRGEQIFGKRSKKPRERISAQIEPLVSLELWQAAQETLARHRICAKNTDRVYLLRSVMVCSTCGFNYVGSMNKGGIWYRCGGQRHERGAIDGRCPGRGIKGDHLEHLISGRTWSGSCGTRVTSSMSWMPPASMTPRRPSISER